jgi:hypothetical protein
LTHLVDEVQRAFRLQRQIAEIAAGQEDILGSMS